ncbi:MAG: hypothetical protein H7842_15385, partial [Gammaproteobacteria bacterium SHHR-1]
MTTLTIKLFDTLAHLQKVVIAICATATGLLWSHTAVSAEGFATDRDEILKSLSRPAPAYATTCSFSVDTESYNRQL